MTIQIVPQAGNPTAFSLVGCPFRTWTDLYMYKDFYKHSKKDFEHVKEEVIKKTE